MILFFDNATAADGVFINNAGTFAGAIGGDLQFYGTSSADHGTFTNNGGAVGSEFGGAGGGDIDFFFETATAADSTIMNTRCGHLQ